MPSSQENTLDESQQQLASNGVDQTTLQQLSDLCVRQNRQLFLTVASYSVAALIVLTAIILITSQVLGLEQTSSQVLLKTIFSIWVAGVFCISFSAFYIYQSKKKNESEFVHLIEKQMPDLEQRLITSTEFQGENTEGISDAFVSQLHVDAKKHIDSQPFQLQFDTHHAQKPAAVALGLAFAFLFAMTTSEKFQSATRFLVWPSPPENLQIVSEEEIKKPTTNIEKLPTTITVDPGDIEMQRGDDVVITATTDIAFDSVGTESRDGVIGGSHHLVLFTQDDQLNWHQTQMMPVNNSEGLAEEFTVNLQQVTKDTRYYVALLPRQNIQDANNNNEPVQSIEYSIALFDLPRIENLSVTYHYPEYTKLEKNIESPGGDIVAPVGTKIQLVADVNKAVSSAMLNINDTAIELGAEQLTVSGEFIVEEDGEYFIELADQSDRKNKDPLIYYIRAIPDRDPEITLRSPGRDKRVMPLEEIVFDIDASDDYGLTQFEFNYSVIGKADKTIDFLKDDKNKDRKNSQTVTTGNTVLYLEDLDVQPGDVVSYSVSVMDNNGIDGPTQKISDIYFLEVVPTSREFSRARSGGGGGGAGGGGGGGGGDGSALVKTQKDVIAATWKLKNRKVDKDDEDYIADGKIIRDSQAEVAQRAKMSISRLTERGSYENDSYEKAVIALQQSLKEMDVAIESLDEMALNKALASEQRALQEILKAEAQINRTEVATNRNRQNGGGGGGQQRDNEDLRELFEMEMGELENRYELPSQAQNGQQQSDPKANELAERLKELARRQERLTRSQRELARRQEQMSEEQKRRQLEKLQREQEQLRRELSQLSQSMSESNQTQSQQNSQQSSSRSSSQQTAQSQRQQQRQQQQMQQLQQALNQMQQSANSETASQAAANSQKALENLQQQAEQMSQGQQQSVADLQLAIKESTERLIEQQQKMKTELQALSRTQSVGNSRSESMNSEETETILNQQREIKETVDDIRKNLRRIASRSNTGDDNEAASSRDIQQSHQLSQSLRPIQEKMETSNMILKRGMVNLSLKLENDIETELAELQREMNGLGNSSVASNREAEANGEESTEQLAQQVTQLRQALQRLQQQVDQRQKNQLSDQLQGERSGAFTSQPDQNQNANVQESQQQANQNTRQSSGQITNSQLQTTLEQSRQIARDLSQRSAQMVGESSQQNNQSLSRSAPRPGQGGGAFDTQSGSRQMGNEIAGSARSIQSALSQQSVEDFLQRPELLEALLQPIIELDNRLKVQSELKKIDSLLYSSKDENIPDAYKTKVENYYRVLSESDVSQ